jgi:hypothetical protein
MELGVKVLGQQHPDTQENICSMVVLYVKLGKQKEGEEMKALLLLIMRQNLRAVTGRMSHRLVNGRTNQQGSRGHRQAITSIPT